jgi:hypothetical protein
VELDAGSSGMSFNEEECNDGASMFVVWVASRRALIVEFALKQLSTRSVTPFVNLYLAWRAYPILPVHRMLPIDMDSLSKLQYTYP